MRAAGGQRELLASPRHAACAKKELMPAPDHLLVDKHAPLSPVPVTPHSVAVHQSPMVKRVQRLRPLRPLQQLQ